LLNDTKSKPSILAVVPAFSQNFVPQSMTESYPPVLTDMRNDDAIGMNYTELLSVCQSSFSKIKVTKEQAEAVEQATRD
jgi:hypothetical protein